MASKVEVSVIIPNFNYSKYIEQCINSVLESDFDLSKLEIVFVDDASTDNSVSIVTKIKKNSKISIQLINNKTNSGLAKTRNVGIKYAKGKYLFFLDSDNYILKDCIQKHYDCLSNMDEYAACYAPIQKFDNDTDNLLDIFSNKEYDLQKLVSGNYIDAMAMIRKYDLLQAGKYDENMPFNGWEDYDLWLKLGYNNKKINFIDGEALSMYRVHSDSMINSISKEGFDELILYVNRKYNITIDSNPVDNIVFPETLKNITPIHYTSVKIFWAAIDLLFSEERSFSTMVELDTIPSIISFRIQQTNNIHFIQLEIGHEIGLINIHEINLKNDSDLTLWSWDKYNTHFKKNLLLINNEKDWGNKIIQLATSNNPIFIFPIDHLQHEKTEEFTIELSLSALDTKQTETLSNVHFPLSYVSEKELEELKLSLSIQQNKSNGVESYKKIIEDLKTIQSRTNESLKISTKEIQHITSEKEKIVSENGKLLQQFTNLKDTHHQLFIQKEKNENDITLLEIQLKESIAKAEALMSEKKFLEVIINSKESDISQKNDELENLKNSLNKANEQSKISAIEHESLKLTLGQTINIKDKELIQKDNVIKELGNKLNILNNELEVLEKKQALKDSKILWFEDTYEKRSTIGIIKDRIFSKK